MQNSPHNGTSIHDIASQFFYAISGENNYYSGFIHHLSKNNLIIHTINYTIINGGFNDKKQGIIKCMSGADNIDFYCILCIFTAVADTARKSGSGNKSESGHE
jgi:hypothetical protein